ncbi:hypothetical protein IWX50DRAFT_617336 [Phyllosticta citricarpa]
MCRQRRPPPSTHRRKLFLVAERLSWEKGRMPLALLERNQEMTWEVNFQLGIYEPFVEDLDQVPGGKKSQENPVYPFENASDFSSVMLLVTKGEDLTEASYDMWQRLLDIVHYSPGPNDVVETHECPGPADAPSVHQTSGPKCSLKNLHEKDEDDLPTPPGSSQLNPRQAMQRATLSPSNSKKSLEKIGRVIQPTPPPSSQPGSDLPSGIPTEPPGLLAQTPPSSSAGTMLSLTPKTEDAGTIDEMPIRPPRRTLPEFYALLDMIERTSYVGAQFLEAYAEGLQNDYCNDCWFTFNIGHIHADAP